MHGYGIALAVHDRTGGDLAVEDAALYQALHRLDRQGLVQAEWRASDNHRRARHYALALGRLRREADRAARAAFTSISVWPRPPCATV